MLLQCCWCLCINRCYTYKVHIPVARYVCYHLLFRLVEVSILRMGLVCYALLTSVCVWYAMLYSHPSVYGMLCFTHIRLWLVCYALLTSVCGWYAMLYSHPFVVGMQCFTHIRLWLVYYALLTWALCFVLFPLFRHTPPTC